MVRSVSHLPDAELVRRAQRGSDVALNALIGRYRRFVRSKSRGYYLVGGDADDLEQEALIGLCKAVRDYRSQAGSFRTFVELCVTRQIMTAIRTANRRKHQPLNQSVTISSSHDDEIVLEDQLVDRDAPGPPDDLIVQETTADVRRTLSEQLSELELHVLGLHIDGWSYVEIAEALGRESKAIDNALQRIRRKLDGALGQNLTGDASETARTSEPETDRPSSITGATARPVT